MAWVCGMVVHLCCLLVAVLWFAVGSYFFTGGFLLTRHEINYKSSCLPTSDRNTCWTVPPISGVYQKFIVIIIDALRYDFADYRSDLSQDLPYQNKLRVFRDLASEHGCESVRLFKFRADAPTTTMQRIKGMTTGSFPTFIDVSNNFDSSEIAEDNIIDQLVVNSNANITFLGDDTWMKLFPGRFSTAYPFPSFDVKDLHLVDNGILKHLVPELERRNWKMLIAHFLGVDHCGHRYGPLHSEMTLKLQQMDLMIRSVVETMENDTILLVMGDHGMTQTGDHGGETRDEIDAALFAFSPSGKFANLGSIKNENCDAGLVHQIDLVPTLSFLMGIPIPFSNLGSAIVDLIPHGGDRQMFIKNVADALHVNAKQVESYLKEYNSRYENFNSVEFKSLMKSFSQMDEKESRNIDNVRHLLHKARDLCKNMWAQFNIHFMTVGLCCFTTICIWLFNHNLSLMNIALMVISNCLYYLMYCYADEASQSIVLCVLLFILSANFAHLVWKHKMSVISIICSLYPLLYTSNSFILSEDSIVLFLCVSALLWICITAAGMDAPAVRKHVPDSKKSSKTPWKFKRILFGFMSKPTCLFVVISILMTVLMRLAFLFRICRPEQYWCFNTVGEHTANGSSQGSNSASSLYYIDSWIDFNDPWTRFFMSGGSIVAILLLAGFRLKHQGNLRNPFSAAVITATKLLPMAAVCIIANWQMHTLPSKDLDTLPSIYVTFLPRCAYVLLLISVLLWLISPLTVHLMYQDRYGRLRDDIDAVTQEDVISHYYQQLKKHLDKENLTMNRNINESEVRRRDVGPPAAFGLYTLLSASLIGLAEVVILLLAMLLVEKYATVLLMFVLSTAAMLELVSAMRQAFKSKNNEVSWDVVGIWVLSSSFWWFAFGHQASLSSIPWNAAFVGFQGSHPTVILPALMVGANVFSSQILHTVLLPLLLLWPVTRGKWFLKAVSHSKNNKTVFDGGNTKHSSVMCESELDFVQSQDFWTLLSDMFYKYIALNALKTLGCMCAAFIHRRHLMVWQIFAPRYIYELLSFFVTCITSLFVYMFIVLVRHSLDRWIKHVNAMQTTKHH